jgi:hypothetical protein
MAKVILYKGSIYSGVVLSEDGVPVCSSCKNKESKATRTMHLDGTDWYSSSYECDCGNGIGVNSKRKGAYTQSDLEATEA